jgi:hypothetical protein
VVPVTRALFLDLLDSVFGLGGDLFPERIEDLTF